MQGAVVWYGVSDFAPLSNMPEANFFLGCRGGSDDGCAEKRRAASPVTYVNGNVPPFLIIHGEGDSVVPVEQARSLANAIRTHKGKAELVLLPGVGHRFVGRVPQDTRAASLRAWERTLGFIERTLGGGAEP